MQPVPPRGAFPRQQVQPEDPIPQSHPRNAQSECGNPAAGPSPVPEAETTAHPYREGEMEHAKAAQPQDRQTGDASLYCPPEPPPQSLLHGRGQPLRSSAPKYFAPLGSNRLRTDLP